MLGTGPYRITEFAADDHVLLERNDAWWGEARRTEAQAVLHTRRGHPARGDAVQGRGRRAQPRLGRGPELGIGRARHVHGRPVGRVPGLRHLPRPFDDIHVRRAFAHAADRDGMVNGILHGKAEAAAALPSRDMWGDLLSAEAVRAGYDAIPALPFDLDAARDELDKSAAKGGFTVDLHYPGSGPQLGKAALALAASLKKIGITLNVKEITLEQWVSELGSGKQPLQFLWYFPVTGDPAELADPYLNADATATNIAHYDRAAVNTALNTAKRSTDPRSAGSC
ncbi:ABC transporter substrate-binding protein [Streptomyces sp. M10(2022)]